MYRRTISVSQRGDNNIFTLYTTHTKDLNQRQWGSMCRIISIDPSIKNFGLRVEQRPYNLEPPFPPDSYQTLLFKRICIQAETSNIYNMITQILDQYLDLFNTCHMVIVERQVPFNYLAVRVSQHVLSYFMIKLQDNPLLPIIMEVDNKLKSRQLQAPSNLNERGIKKWSIDKAIEILTSRNDTYALNILREEIKKKKKLDDLADTVCQVEALFSYLGLP